MSMTVGELKDFLEDIDDDVEIIIAEQPRWAFEYGVSDIHEVVLDDGETLLIIEEGEQLQYLRSTIANQIGW